MHQGPELVAGCGHRVDSHPDSRCFVWNRPEVTHWARSRAHSRGVALRRVPMVGEFLDIVHEAEQLPLSIDLGAAPQREPRQAFVVP